MSLSCRPCSDLGRAIDLLSRSTKVLESKKKAAAEDDRAAADAAAVGSETAVVEDVSCTAPRGAKFQLRFGTTGLQLVGKAQFTIAFDNVEAVLKVPKPVRLLTPHASTRDSGRVRTHMALPPILLSSYPPTLSHPLVLVLAGPLQARQERQPSPRGGQTRHSHSERQK